MRCPRSPVSALVRRRTHRVRALAILSVVLAGCAEATAPARPVEQGAGETTGGSATAPPPAFRVGFVDLGLLPGATGGVANAVNEGGQVVGTLSFASGTSRAFRWTVCTGLEDLSPLLGGGTSGAADVNDRGEIVGSLTTAGGTRGFRLGADGTLLVLGPPRELAAAGTVALGINDAGVVVGSTVSSSFLLRGPVRWDELGVPLALPDPPGGTRAVAINARGEILGDEFTGFASSPVWRPPTFEATRVRVPGHEEAHGTDLNDAQPTQVVGWATGFRLAPNTEVDLTTRRAFIWTEAAGGRLLGSLAGLPTSPSEANAINDQGQVVGTSGGRAFIWTAAGGMQELTMPAGYTNGIALDLNERGMIAGTATAPDGGLRPVLWLVQPRDGGAAGSADALWAVQGAGGSCGG